MLLKDSAPPALAMIIDDDAVHNFFHERFILEQGIAQKVIVHRSTHSGLEYLQSIERLEMFSALPRLLFLNLNMPLMDGHQFMRAFQKLSPQTQQEIKIFVLTSSLHSYQVSLEEGWIEDYLIKPLSLAHLPLLTPYVGAR